MFDLKRAVAEKTGLDCKAILFELAEKMGQEDMDGAYAVLGAHGLRDPEDVAFEQDTLRTFIHAGLDGMSPVEVIGDWAIYKRPSPIPPAWPAPLPFLVLWGSGIHDRGRSFANLGEARSFCRETPDGPEESEKTSERE